MLRCRALPADCLSVNASLVNKRSFIITLGLLTATAALTIDLSLPAVPDMVQSLPTTLPKAQLIVGVFMAGMAFGQIPAGLFSDRLGRLPVLYTGIALFTLAATVAASAQSIEVLLAARFVQGIGGASAVVLSRAIVRDIASGRDAARLMSLMTMIFTAAPVIAPSIGALMVGQFGWRAPLVAIAAGGFLLPAAIRANLVETHEPNVTGHPVRQLANSIREFFSHRESIFGLLLIIIPPAGFMSIIAVSAALVVEIFGFSLQQYGLIFALAGVAILLGSMLNRFIVVRLSLLQLMTLGAVLLATSSLQLLLIAWLDRAVSPVWLWGCVCLYMFTIPILMSNAMVMALDPLPNVAGVASSVIGTIQNIIGAGGAMVGAMIYDGSVRNAVIIIGTAGTLTSIVYLMRPLIAPGHIQHREDKAVG